MVYTTHSCRTWEWFIIVLTTLQAVHVNEYVGTMSKLFWGTGRVGLAQSGNMQLHRKQHEIVLIMSQGTGECS